jgi:hypothetical protein
VQFDYYDPDKRGEGLTAAESLIETVRIDNFVTVHLSPLPEVSLVGSNPVEAPPEVPFILAATAKDRDGVQCLLTSGPQAGSLTGRWEKLGSGGATVLAEETRTVAFPAACTFSVTVVEALEGLYTYRFTATNDSGRSTSRLVQVTITGPIVRFAVPPPEAVLARSSVVLDASSSTGGPLAYRWSIRAGGGELPYTSEGIGRILFYVPVEIAGEIIAVKVTVTNASGRQSTRQLTIRVLQPIPPSRRRP